MKGFKCPACGLKRVVAVCDGADGPHSTPSEGEMDQGAYLWMCTACGDTRPGTRGMYCPPLESVV